MGHIGDPPLLGNDCTVCDNCLWLPGKTPRKIVLAVRGMVKTIHWLEEYGKEYDGLYTLWQHAVYPCNWSSTSDEPGAFLILTDFGADLFITTSTGYRCFENSPVPKCQTSYDNIHLESDGDPFEGGQAFLLW